MLGCRIGLCLAPQLDCAARGGQNGPGFGVSGKLGRQVLTMTWRAVLLGLLMLITTLPTGAGDRIAMKVSPAVAFAPANLVVRAMIAADPENRVIAVVAASDDFYRSSEIQLEGDKAPRTTTFEFRHLPSGTYEVRARLLGADGRERGFVRQSVNVISSVVGRN